LRHQGKLFTPIGQFKNSPFSGRRGPVLFEGNQGAQLSQAGRDAPVQACCGLDSSSTPHPWCRLVYGDLHKISHQSLPRRFSLYRVTVLLWRRFRLVCSPGPEMAGRHQDEPVCAPVWGRASRWDTSGPCPEIYFFYASSTNQRQVILCLSSSGLCGMNKPPW
jgi:hypothetical protein